MPTNGNISGEDKVIIVCVGMLTLLTIVALVTIVLVPSSTNTIIPVMAGTVIAISSLAARHPPIPAPALVAAPATESPAGA